MGVGSLGLSSAVDETKRVEDHLPDISNQAATKRTCSSFVLKKGWIMLKKLIDIYEEIKENVYIIDRGTLEPIIIKFSSENFYHLIGLHKLNIDMFFPRNMKSKDKRYKHMKKNTEKYENIIKNQIKGKHTLELRINTFPNIKNLFDDVSLYNLKQAKITPLYKGDYGLLKLFDNIYCLLGIKMIDYKELYLYTPQTWIADKRILIKQTPKYYKSIIIIPKTVFGDNCINIYSTVKQMVT